MSGIKRKATGLDEINLPYESGTLSQTRNGSANGQRQK